MALKSSREGLRKELVDYLGNIIIDDNLRNEIVKAVDDKFVTPEILNENVNNLTMQITTERGERIEGDETLQNRITTEVSVRENADNTLQNNINAETTAREEAVTNLQELIATSGLKTDLLWTNASPTSEFASQTINLDLSNYKFIIILGRAFTNREAIELMGLFHINGEKYKVTNMFSVNITRDVIINGNGITFSNGGYFDIYNSDNSWVSVNTSSIPVYIYGIK